MSSKLKRILELWVVLVLIDGCALASLIVSVFYVPNVWGVVIGSGFVAFSFYWYYVRRIKGRKPRYPLVPPEGKADVYLPRTDIPRPVHADFREMEEKKRKFARIKKMARKGVRRKKK